MKTLLSLIWLPLVFIACQKDEGTGPVPLAAESRPNVAYGNDPAQKMDIYLPAGRTTSSTKVIILVHGGGWNAGDKTDYDPYIDTLKKRLPGYAIFNINYRLATGTSNFFPTQENDVKAAIEFIYNKKSEYSISDKFVLLGMSAGGHLVLLQAYKVTSPIKIKAVVDFFGPTELVDLYNNPPNPLVPVLLQQVTGGTPVSLPALYQSSSPVNFVTAQSPPTIILQGGADPVVSASQSVLLKNTLLTAGVTHQYVFYPTEGHGWVGANMVDSFDKIQAFLQANVN
jgi:acetyl esterase/lipase